MAEGLVRVQLAGGEQRRPRGQREGVEVRLGGVEWGGEEAFGDARRRWCQLVVAKLVQPRCGWPYLGAEHVRDRLRTLADAEQRQLVLDALADPAVLFA